MLDATLPDERKIEIDPGIAERLSCGVLVLDSVVVAEDDRAAAETDALSREMVIRYSDLLPSEIPGLAEARRLYKSFGVDPSRHRPSSEALLRRVLGGKDLYQINSAVDCCNLASLNFLLPVGLYDLDRVVGDIILRVGGPGQEYPGIRKGMVHLEDRLGLFDQEGPFGSPTSDSSRTCVTEGTARILAVIMATADYSPAAMTENLDYFSALFARHCQSQTGARCLLGHYTESE
jgi:DNA/RNA-binding domain of Phe-tRNA-synthetase-like protein